MTSSIAIVCVNATHVGGRVWVAAEFDRSDDGLWRERTRHGRIPVNHQGWPRSKPGRDVTTKAPHKEFLVDDRPATRAELSRILAGGLEAVDGARIRYVLECGFCHKKLVRREDRLLEELERFAALGVLEVPLSAFDA